MINFQRDFSKDNSHNFKIKIPVIFAPQYYTLRQKLLLLLVLNIYTSVFLNLRSQEVNVQIQPKNTFADSVANSQLQVDHYESVDAVSLSAKAINIALQQTGFIDSTIDSIAQDDKNFTVHISTGIRSKYIKAIYKDSIISDYAQRLNLQPENNTITLPFNKTENFLESIIRLEAKNGRPLSQAYLSNLRKKDSVVTADLILEKSDDRKLDSIVVLGYEKFPIVFLEKGIGIKTDRRFNTEEIQTKLKKVRSLPFVSETKEPEILFRESETQLYLYLKKKQTNRLDGFIGFGTNENTGKLRINGNAEIRLQNNLNFGESLDLNYRSDGNDQRSLNIDLNLPYILKSPLGIDAGLNLFRRDSTFSTATQHLDLVYKLRSNLDFSTGIYSENSTGLTESQNAAIEDYNKTFYTLSSIYHKPSENILTEHSTALEIKLGTGKRKTSNSKTQQYLIAVNAEQSIPVIDKLKINIYNSTQYLISDNYIENELYRFGGIKTIRGFSENSISGYFHSSFMNEVRYFFSEEIMLNLHFDASFYKNDLVNELIYSSGAGINLLVNSTILKINASNPISNENFQFSDTIFHISLITLF